MTRYTRSDQGQRRSRNEDFALSFKLDDLFGIVVADGLGGHVAGHIASELAATTFANAVQRLDDGTLDRDLMALAFEQAETAVQSRIAADPEEYGKMGTTLVAALIRDTQALVGHVGDSRGYLLRADVCRQLTDDHVETEFYGQAGHTQKRTYLSNVIGGSESGISVDICELELGPEDILLLCTDGLTRELSDSHIQRLVGSSSSLSEAGDDLIEAANASGGNDNITVGLFKRP